MRRIPFGFIVLAVIAIGFSLNVYHVSVRSPLRHFDLLITIAILSSYCGLVARKKMPAARLLRASSQFVSSEASSRKFFFVSAYFFVSWVVGVGIAYWGGLKLTGRSDLGWVTLVCFGLILLWAWLRHFETYRLQVTGVSLVVNGHAVAIQIGEEQTGRIAVSQIESVKPLIARSAKAVNDAGRNLGEAAYTANKGAGVPLLLVLKPGLSIDELDWPLDLKVQRQRFIQSFAYSACRREGVIVPGVFSDMLAVRRTLEESLSV